MGRLSVVIALLILLAPVTAPAAGEPPSGGFFTSSLVSDTVNVSVAAKWNMVSVPLEVADLHRDSLFPSAISSAFAYDAGYVAEDPLQTGRGYWLKFAAAGTIPLFGTAVHRDTVTVAKGWNMVGTISDPVPVAGVTTVPPEMTLSTFFGYNAGYTSSTSLEPGKSYWVKASVAGWLILDGTAASKPAPPPDLSGLNLLEIRDAAGMKQTLRFGDERSGVAGLGAEMPPPPPAGVFDARFSSGNWLEYYRGAGDQRYTVMMQSASYPVTIRWEIAGNESRPVTLNGSLRVSGEGSVVLREAAPVTIDVGGSSLPARFSLAQNYPNPFNPVTKIMYDLPVDAHVRLVLYDLLGREVRVLADGAEIAGTRTVELDASDLPTGVYFYRIRAGDFTATRKMLLMK